MEKTTFHSPIMPWETLAAAAAAAAGKQSRVEREGEREREGDVSFFLEFNDIFVRVKNFGLTRKRV